MNVMQIEVVTTIRDVFKTDLGVEIEDNDLDFFQQMKVDSLAFLNVVARLEKMYSIKFANEELPGLNTCHKLADGIITHQSGR